MSRYANKNFVVNDDEFYRSLFESRGVKSIKHFPTPKLNHVSQKQIASLNTIGHVWTTGDRYFKLAHDHYGDSRMWWVIAWFNKKPTESDVDYGDVIYIPHPLDRILMYLGV
jgi:hypothetical protein